MNLTAAAVQVQAYLSDATISASQALTLDANSSQSISAIVAAGSAAVSGGSTTGLALTAAGVYSDNRIQTYVKAYIDGDGSGISAGSVSLTADDASGIDSIAGAASVGAAIGGTTGASVAIGLSVAFNEVSNEVEAFIRNADQGVTTTSGDITISSTSQGQHLVDLTLGGTVTVAKLDDAAKADQDDPGTSGTNEANADASGDMAFLGDLRAAINAALVTSGRPVLAIADTVATEAMLTTQSGLRDLSEGSTVKLSAGYAGGTGIAGRVYRYIGANAVGVALSTQNYADASKWLLVDKLKLSTLVAGKSWTLVSGDGTSYVLELDSATGKLKVSKNNVNAVSAAAALSAGFGGTTGVAISGAGAVAQNVVLTKTNAYGQNSIITSADDVALSALPEHDCDRFGSRGGVGGRWRWRDDRGGCFDRHLGRAELHRLDARRDHRVAGAGTGLPQGHEAGRFRCPHADGARQPKR